MAKAFVAGNKCFALVVSLAIAGLTLHSAFAALAAQGCRESSDSSGDAFFCKSGETVLDRIQDVRILSGDARTAYRDPAIWYEDGTFHLFFTLVETEAAWIGEALDWGESYMIYLLRNSGFGTVCFATD